MFASLDRSIVHPLRSRSAPSKRFHVIPFPITFPGSSSCPRRFSRSFLKKGFLGDRCSPIANVVRRTKQHPFAFCCSSSRVSLSYHRIRGYYISYFRLIHENTSDTYGQRCFIFDTKKPPPSVATTFCLVLPYQMFLRIPFVNHIFSRIVYPLLEPRYS